MAKEMQLNAELIPITTSAGCPPTLLLLLLPSSRQVDAHTRPEATSRSRRGGRKAPTQLPGMVSHLNHANARTAVNKSRSTRCPSPFAPHSASSSASASASTSSLLLPPAASCGPFCGMFQHEFDILVHSILFFMNSDSRTCLALCLFERFAN